MIYLKDMVNYSMFFLLLPPGFFCAERVEWVILSHTLSFLLRGLLHAQKLWVGGAKMRSFCAHQKGNFLNFLKLTLTFIYSPLLVPSMGFGVCVKCVMSSSIIFLYFILT